MTWGWLAMAPFIIGVIWMLVVITRDTGWGLLLGVVAGFVAFIAVVGLFVWGLITVTGGAG